MILGVDDGGLGCKAVLDLLKSISVLLLMWTKFVTDIPVDDGKGFILLGVKILLGKSLLMNEVGDLRLTWLTNCINVPFEYKSL
jgi:hypothetical protein